MQHTHFIALRHRPKNIRIKDGHGKQPMLKFLCVLCVAGLVILRPVQALTQTPMPRLSMKSLASTPALISADKMTYDANTATVTAIGNVEIIQASRILNADSITYDKSTDIVRARGNISLMEPNGMVVFADEVELRDALKRGVVEHFRARFPDDSLMAARRGERLDESTITIDHVVYSPCPVCKEKPDKDPLWQVSAKKATIDNTKEQVRYKHAFFEIYGIPTLYTPYFSHPTPNADRKSGFLTPKYSHDRVFGTVIKTPYYYNIAPNKDATITPIFTANEGEILSGEYRHLLKSGTYQLKVSATNPEKVDASGNKVEGHDVRSHIEGQGEFAINNAWSWGFYGKRASDDTYLKKYHFGEEDVLTSNLYATHMEDRDYILLNTLSFQGLKVTDDPGKSPLILPYGESYMERKVNSYGTRVSMDTNVLALTRAEGVSSRRISVKGGVLHPLITPSGQVIEAGASLRGDGYSVDNVPRIDGVNGTYDAFAARAIPEASLKWSMPFIKTAEKQQYLIEPVTKLVVSPNGGNPNEIPNEDSQDIEFSAENLFDSNHFSGYDKIENGTRVNYGIRGGISDTRRGEVSYLFGQSYRAKKDADFSVQSGLADNFSDYIGKVGYNKGGIFDIAYKFRFDKDSLAARNTTVAGELNYAPVRFSMDYVAINESAASTSTTREETREIMIAGTTIDLTDKWQLEGDGNRNLASGEWVSTRSGLVYKGACVDLRFDWVREFTRDRDIQPGSTFSFQVSLRNLGQDDQ